MQEERRQRDPTGIVVHGQFNPCAGVSENSANIECYSGENAAKALQALNRNQPANQQVQLGDVVVIAKKQQSGDCGSGPRLVIGRSFGGTAFGGVGDFARGVSVNAGIGLSIPLNFFKSGSLAGTQVYGNFTLTDLVAGFGAFAASTTGRSDGYANGPMTSHIPSPEDPGAYVFQAGGAWEKGAEVQVSRPIDNIAMSERRLQLLGLVDILLVSGK